jgi:prepilin-type N-terminal cleavage/methylation domain-containing protein
MRGVTLLELIVALALFGLILGVSVLSLASLQPARKSAAIRAMEHAHADAIRMGSPVRVDSVLYLPDGRAIGPGVDPLTGSVHVPR